MLEHSLPPAFQVVKPFIVVLQETPSLKDLPTRSAQDLLLVEPKLSTTQIKRFTGTLGQVKRADKIGATILAFLHWVAQETAGQLVFADVQGLYPLL